MLLFNGCKVHQETGPSTGAPGPEQSESPDAGTSPNPAADPDADAGADSGAPPLSLDPKPGTYQGTCDGSGAVALDADHFLDVNDEDQSVRIFRRGAAAVPTAQTDVSTSIGLTSADEADFEDAARIGNRVYVVTSHGRDSKGVLQPARYRFLALDLGGEGAATTVKVAGWSKQLLQDLLVPANWATAPEAALISLLTNSSQLDGAATIPDLAAEVNGINIEGMAALPTDANPQRLVLGLRNPQTEGAAILVTLLNPDQVVAGATAKLGEAIRLDLGGLGVRGMAWSTAHKALLVLAGPKASDGPFRIYKWSGDPAAKPVEAMTLTTTPNHSPEAIVPYPGTLDVQIVLDMGDNLIGAKTCKKVDPTLKFFSDQIVHID